MTDNHPLDLDAIRARATRYAEDREIAAAHGLAASLTAVDVDLLLAEVTALRAELDAARAEHRIDIDPRIAAGGTP